MKFFRWLRGFAKRSITSLPWIAGGPNRSRVTADRALTLIPFFACVRLLADQVASLPLQPYRSTGDVRTPMSTDPQLLQSPATRGTLFDWKYRCVVSLAIRGNAYGLVLETDGFGFPIRIEWLNPDDVHVDESQPTMPVYYWQGQRVPSEQIVHIPWFAQPGSVKSLSPVAAFAKTLGVGLSATDYGETWFENGGQPPATFKNSEKTVTADEAETITSRLVAKIRSGKPLVYGADWDYNALSVTPSESQFIETMKLNATQIAAIFGIPPEMVGGESGSPMTYQNVEQQSLNFVTFTLRPWLVRIESVLSGLLPERQYVRFNVDAMVRADLKTRYEAHHLALTDGWKSKDEIRAIEDLAPLPNGQGSGFAPIIATPPPRTPPPAEPESGRDEPTEDVVRQNGHQKKEVEHVQR